jgi:hypothetical protein
MGPKFLRPSSGPSRAEIINETLHCGEHWNERECRVRTAMHGGTVERSVKMNHYAERRAARVDSSFPVRKIRLKPAIMTAGRLRLKQPYCEQ